MEVQKEITPRYFWIKHSHGQELKAFGSYKRVGICNVFKK